MCEPQRAHRHWRVHGAAIALLSLLVHLGRHAITTLILPCRPRERCHSPVSRLCGGKPATLSSDEITVDTITRVGVPVEVAQHVHALAKAVSACGSEPLSDPLTLLRYYNGRGQNVDKAAASYFKTLEWRAKVSLQQIMSSHGEGESYTTDGYRTSDAASWKWQRDPRLDITKLVARHVAFARLEGAASAEGEPVFVWRFCANDFAGFDRHQLQDALIHSYIAHIEDAFQALRCASIDQRRLVRGRFIIDIKGSNLDAVRYLPSLKRAIAIGQQYYPEVVTSVTVVRAPAFAAFLWKRIRMLLPRKFQQKMCVLGGTFETGLKNHAGVDAAMLPAFLGGGNFEVELT